MNYLEPEKDRISTRNGFMPTVSFSISNSKSKAKTPKDALVVSILFGIFGLTAFNTLGLLALSAVYLALASQKPPTLVQLVDGQAITAIPSENTARSPELVQQFATQQVLSLMTWTGELPADGNQNGKPLLDPGVDVASSKGIKKISTTAWQAGFSFSEDFRKGLMASVAELTPADVFLGRTKVILIPRSITLPQEVEKGKWKVNLVANLVTFSPLNQSGDSVAFNKQIFIHAIDIPKLKSNSSPLEQAIFKVRSNGLEIYAMRDLARTDLTDP